MLEEQGVYNLLTKRFDLTKSKGIYQFSSLKNLSISTAENTTVDNLRMKMVVNKARNRSDSDLN